MAGIGTVTIGVPVYNGAATLRRALECLQNQTYRDIKVIISDNASTDESARIAQEFVDADPRFRLVRQQQNVGPVPNFFSLLEMADTDYFMWRADDDWSDADYVEKLILLFERNLGTRLAAGQVVFVRPNGSVNRIDRSSRPRHRLRVFRIGHVLMNVSASSIYGLWHRPTLVENLRRTKEAYPYVWAWDLIALLPVILGESVSATNETKLYVGQPETPRYSARERAETMWKMRRTFRKACLVEVRRHRWDWWERPILWIFILRYANIRVYRFWKTVRRHVRQVLGINHK